MNWPMVVAFGAIGGSLRGLLAAYGHVELWLRSRRDNHRLGRPIKSVKFHECADWRAEAVGTIAQIVLAILASTILFSTETVTTVVGLILGGASAPAILAQLGQVPLVSKAVIGQTGLKQTQENGDKQGTGLSEQTLLTLEPASSASSHAHDRGEDAQEAADA